MLINLSLQDTMYLFPYACILEWKHADGGGGVF